MKILPKILREVKVREQKLLDPFVTNVALIGGNSYHIRGDSMHKDEYIVIDTDNSVIRSNWQLIKTNLEVVYVDYFEEDEDEGEGIMYDTQEFAFSDNGFDPNKNPKEYHDYLTQYIIPEVEKGSYNGIEVMGFSVGGLKVMEHNSLFAKAILLLHRYLNGGLFVDSAPQYSGSEDVGEEVNCMIGLYYNSSRLTKEFLDSIITLPE